MSMPTKLFIEAMLQVEVENRLCITEILLHGWMRADPVAWETIKDIYIYYDTQKLHVPAD